MEGHFAQFAILLAVLALAAGISVWLRFPVVPLYIVAGLVLGRVIEPDATVSFVGSLGVVFLLFHLGLEFSLGGSGAGARRLVVAGGADWVFNFPVGLAMGWLFGFSLVECLLLAGIVYMSSSAVVTKCIIEFDRAARPETETILRILVFEDFVIAIFLVALQPVLQGSPEDLGDPAWWGLARSLLFLLVLIATARYLTRPIERLLATRSDEAFTLVLFAFVLGVAASAIAAGLSEAVGAFLAGLVFGATSLKERASRTLSPFQTLFAALFFVSFAMGIEGASVVPVLGPVVVLVVLGLATKSLGGFVAARLAGHPPAPSLAVGLSLIPKGEFSLLLAGLAASAQASSARLEALAALYVVALSVLGPIAMREADRAAVWPLKRRRPQEDE